jgi:hypothetical protein
VISTADLMTVTEFKAAFDKEAAEDDGRDKVDGDTLILVRDVQSGDEFWIKAVYDDIDRLIIEIDLTEDR